MKIKNPNCDTFAYITCMFCIHVNAENKQSVYCVTNMTKTMLFALLELRYMIFDISYM